MPFFIWFALHLVRPLLALVIKIAAFAKPRHMAFLLRAYPAKKCTPYKFFFCCLICAKY